MHIEIFKNAIPSWNCNQIMLNFRSEHIIEHKIGRGLRT